MDEFKLEAKTYPHKAYAELGHIYLLFWVIFEVL
jgi:hypothetical protein